MGALIGLMLGLGVLLIWTSWQDTPHRHRVDRQRSARRRSIPVRQLAAGLGAAAAAAVVVWMATGVLAIATVAGAAASMIPATVVAGRERRRRREQAEAWPDAVDHLASAVRAGLSLPESVMNLAEHGPESLRSAFAGFARDYQSSGRFIESLERLKAELADPTGDRVVEALRLAREVGGGDLGRMLRSLSGFLRDDLRTRAELEARQSWAVAGARLAVAAPWLVLALMSGRREVIAQFGEPTGIAILAGGFACCVVAYRLMLRAGRLPLEERVLG